MLPAHYRKSETTNKEINKTAVKFHHPRNNCFVEENGRRGEMYMN